MHKRCFSGLSFEIATSRLSEQGIEGVSGLLPNGEGRRFLTVGHSL